MPPSASPASASATAAFRNSSITPPRRCAPSRYLSRSLHLPSRIVAREAQPCSAARPHGTHRGHAYHLCVLEPRNTPEQAILPEKRFDPESAWPPGTYGSDGGADQRADVKGDGQKDEPKRGAEPVTITQEREVDEKEQPQSEQERGLEQEPTVPERKVAVDSAEQKQSGAVACVEPHPGPPHRGVSRDHGRDLLEPCPKLGVVRMQLVSGECVEEV